MKTFRLIFISVSLILFLNSCGKEEIDNKKPEIDLNIQEAFPVNCDTLYFGETFTFKSLFTDNVELGSYSIDIHHNFDHHSHSTEVTECTLGPKKDPVNPLTFIQDYQIPQGLKNYETNHEINILSGNNISEFDEGDYHFFINLTDKEGWSAQKGLSIKILRRD